LHRPYDGPFLVLERHEKHFTLDKNGTPDTVSLDRLKPAFIAQDPRTAPLQPESSLTPPPVPLSLPQSAPRTRSGRAVNLPVRFRTGGEVV
jgi:hypothetical protein